MPRLLSTNGDPIRNCVKLIFAQFETHAQMTFMSCEDRTQDMKLSNKISALNCDLRSCAVFVQAFPIGNFTHSCSQTNLVKRILPPIRIDFSHNQQSATSSASASPLGLLHTIYFAVFISISPFSIFFPLLFILLFIYI